jgi:hypothetical protein
VRRKLRALAPHETALPFGGQSAAAAAGAGGAAVRAGAAAEQAAGGALDAGGLAVVHLSLREAEPADAADAAAAGAAGAGAGATGSATPPLELALADELIALHDALLEGEELAVRGTAAHCQ